jgi:acetyl/propionyl-CoA carboxylase alpha subunit
MSVTAKIQQYVDDYRSKVNELTGRIAATQNRIEEIELEAKYLREKEIPEASVKRVLDGDSSLEIKLKKTLAKLEAELIEKQEEILILSNALQRYKIQSVEGLKQFHQLFIDERTIASQKAYSKMMAKKREYVETLKAESEVLHHYQALDVKMQEIELEAGLRNGIYNTFAVDSAPVPGHLNRHNGVYLAIPNEEVQKVIKKQPIDLSYLDRFKHTKAL